jgi:hypothetical protein
MDVRWIGAFRTPPSDRMGAACYGFRGAFGRSLPATTATPDHCGAVPVPSRVVEVSELSAGMVSTLSRSLIDSGRWCFGP